MGQDGVISVGEAFLHDRYAHGAHEVALGDAEDFDGGLDGQDGRSP
jgi:hypothetical protein